MIYRVLIWHKLKISKELRLGVIPNMNDGIRISDVTFKVLGRSFILNDKGNINYINLFVEEI